MQSLNQVENSIESYLYTKTSTSHFIYLIVLIFIIAILASLPFIYIDISSQSFGVIRPKGEKTEIKASVSELIDSVYVTEGQEVKKGDILLSMRTSSIEFQKDFQETQMKEYADHIEDLSQLMRGKIPIIFKSSVIKQEYSLYIKRKREAEIALNKATKDLNRHAALHEKGVISNEEFEDYEHRKMKAEIELMSVEESQLNSWSANLNSYRIQYRESLKYFLQEEANLEMYRVKSPVDGTLDFFSGIYVGGTTRIGETLAVVSPDSTLYVESHVSPKDIGNIAMNMPVTIHVESFNYNEWGLLNGTVYEISSDFFQDPTTGSSYYKVKCRLDRDYLALNDGRKGYVKKGMTVQTNFIVARRSLFQLLYMKIDDIFNPRQIQEQRN